MSAQDRGQLVEPHRAPGSREPHPPQPDEGVERDPVRPCELGGLLRGQQDTQVLPYDEQRIELRADRPLPQEPDVQLTRAQGGELVRGGRCRGCTRVSG
nr:MULTISPECIES: hypothetical protein [unclassified Streptomyces]